MTLSVSDPILVGFVLALVVVYALLLCGCVSGMCNAQITFGRALGFSLLIVVIGAAARAVIGALSAADALAMRWQQPMDVVVLICMIVTAWLLISEGICDTFGEPVGLKTGARIAAAFVAAAAAVTAFVLLLLAASLM